MEFKFNVNEIFKTPIVEINQTLIPPGFVGDRRALWDAIHKVSEVVNAMGDASAAAQGLAKPITTADRFRNAEQTIYLLIDKHAKNGKGVVTGMLKTGKKSLYVFDRDGQHYQVAPPCVLDFYVHESRQRTGLGKQLFEHMLQKENVEPVKLAVDRPSEKLLSFLDKHYDLNNALRQMNNYVVFDGFFPESSSQANKDLNGDSAEAESSPSRTKQSTNGIQQHFSSPYGRYGAPRPPCSMGQIIHNQSPVQSNEPSGEPHKPPEESVSQSPKLERPRSLSIQRSEESESLDKKIMNDIKSEAQPDDVKKIHDELDNIENDVEKIEIAENVPQLNAANPAENNKHGNDADTDRSKSPNPLTAQGFYDLKFYHSRLW